jgi:tetratricopeptide (TPR) repeat protein
MSTTQDKSVVGSELEALKVKIQQSFNQQQFELATQQSMEALELIKALPLGESIAETIQIHVNLSTACIHTNRLDDAIHHATFAVETAEKGLEMAKDNPQAHEILAITLNSLAQSLTTKGGDLGPAQQAAQRAITICESIYPTNDPRLHKPLRSLGVVLEKKGDLADAEKTFKRAYLMLHLSVGPQVPEAQMLTEDLINFYMRKNDIDAAEQQAQKNYKGICDRPQLNDRDQLILADSASRYASLLLRRGKFALAEPVVERALNLREQSRVMNRNPLGIAFGIVQLCAIREQLNKLDQSAVQMMMRAIDIFSKLRGPQSSEVTNSVAQLQTIRTILSAKEASTSSSKDGADDDDDDLKYTVKDSKSGAAKRSTTSTEKLISDAKHNAKTNEISEEDKRKMASIKPEDGNTRMALANMYFQQSKYNCAEILLAEAFEIFRKELGLEHQATKAAQQNLAVTRANRLNQLWMEIVSEESLAIKMDSMSLNGKDPVRHYFYILADVVLLSLFSSCRNYLGG